MWIAMWSAAQLAVDMEYVQHAKTITSSRIALAANTVVTFAMFARVLRNVKHAKQAITRLSRVFITRPAKNRVNVVLRDAVLVHLLESVPHARRVMCWVTSNVCHARR